MIYNFNEQFVRVGSEKWTYDRIVNGYEVLPMGVADMDLVSPIEVQEALNQVVKRREFGYASTHPDFNQVIAKWFEHHYQANLDPSKITEIPGLITTLGTLIARTTKACDKVVLMTPVYHCFKSCINANGRETIDSDLLKDENNYYTIDFEKLEQDCAREDAKYLILCNPHNPVGRLWSEEELKKIVEICHKTQTILISDEIHGDFTYEGRSYNPILKVAQDKSNILVLSSGGKIFNIGGFFSAFALTYDDKLKKELNNIIHAFHFQPTSFGHEAAYAGYKFGYDYRKQITEHVRQMQLKLCEGIKKLQLPIIAPLPEATYLVWADFNPTGLSADEIHEFLYKDAGLGFNRGDSFGQKGAGFARINCAVPECYIDEALKRLKQAFDKRFK